jgi:putative addiction module antidote
MIHKILSVGDSAAVTIPKKVLKEIGLEIGDKVAVEYDQNEKKIHIEQVIAVDEKVAKLTRNFINRYREALEALAKK